MALFFQMQAQLPVGTFRDHLPYHSFKSIAITPETVYAAGESGILCVNKADKTISTLTKIEGLSETSISKIFYINETKTLIVAYTNANLDFIRDDKLTNVSDIKNKQMVGSKAIHNFLVYDGLLYLACDFGVVVINPNNYLIKETWFTRANDVNYEVKDIAVSQNKFFIATDKGIFYIATNNVNIANFAEWKLLTPAGTHKYDMLKYFNGTLLAHKEGVLPGQDSLFIYNHQEWRYLSEIDYEKIHAIDVRGAELLVCEEYKLNIYDTQFNLRFSFSGWYHQFYENAETACFDGNFDLWVGDKNNGLVHISRINREKTFYLKEGPHSTLAYQMDIKKGVMAVVPGANAGYQNSYTQGNFSRFQDEEWTIYRFSLYDELFQNNIYDLCGVSVNPKNENEIFASSWGRGVVQFKRRENPYVYNTDNSTLQYSSVHGDRILVGDITFDNHGRVWMTNSFCTKPLSVRQPDNTWYAFSLSPYVVGSHVVDKILVDSRNYKWITVPQANKLVVFYDNNTLSNTSDDQITSVDLNALANVQTTTLTALAEDLDGKIWIGTNQGVKVIHNPQQPFANSIYAQNILMEVNGAAQNLLEFENITAIVVDDANRKWIGTSKAGAFLISANGTEEILHFTDKNSPLFSNQVNDIAINHLNGEVFFATDKGIISYRGTASQAYESYENAMVFPNPVREDYQGVISVMGLMNNSFCKIVDAVGQLVWQGYAEGGQLNWNGKDFYGKKPATGVYFVFSSDETGKEKNVAKILFIK